MLGTVVKFDAIKAYGFIRLAESEGEIFCHISACRGRRAPLAGELVEFDLKMDNQNRPTAVDVRAAEDAIEVFQQQSPAEPPPTF